MSSTNSYINARGATLTDAAAHTFWAASPGKTNSSVGGGHTLYADGTSDLFYIYSGTDQVNLPAVHGVDTVSDGAWYSTYTLAAGVQNLIFSGNDQVGVGNSLDNLIIAETGTTTMSGGGGDDIFVDGTGPDTIIDPAGSGSDVIYGFKHTTDIVNLQGSSLTSFSSVVAAMSQVGADVVLNLGSGQTLTFRNDSIASFVPANFYLPVSTAGMTMSFDDEFNSLSASPTGQGTTWDTTYSGGMRTNGGSEYYSDSSVGVNPFSVSNGVLAITAAPASAGSAPAGLNYTSGVITTQHSYSQLYGYFEISAEMPAQAGFWPAFWLLPANNTWPPELDAVEQLTSNNSSEFVTAHTNVGGFNTQISSTVGITNTSQGFNTYGVYWGPDYIRWYFNGQEIASTPTPADMNTAMYMLINLGVVGANGGWEGAAPTAGTTAQMLVNYVHAFAYTGSDPMLTGSVATPPTVITPPPAAAPTPATATLSANQINFGTVHVRDMTYRTLTVTNGATGPNTDVLTGGFGAVTSPFSGSGTLGAGLAAGSSGNLSVILSGSTAGVVSGLATLSLDSTDATTGNTPVGASSIMLSGTIDSYATAAVTLTGAHGTLTQSGTSSLTLDLGTISPQSTGESVALAVTNTAVGPADLLGGSFAASGAPVFYNSGLSAFSGLAAGQAGHAVNILFTSGQSGVYSETIVLSAAGSNASGYSGALPSETLTITGTVSPIYQLTTGNDAIGGGAGNDTIVTTAAELNPGDTIYGGGGTNTLSLVGGGTFNLASLASISSMQDVAAQEGAGSAMQTLDMRTYFNVTVNVQAPASGTGGIVINGANDSSVFNLGSGNDIVFLGSSREVVNGGGQDTVYASSTSELSAALNGGGSGSTLVVTASAAATLGSAVTNFGTVALAPATGVATLTTNAMAGLAVLGSAGGGDTITLSGATQSVIGGGANEHVLASAANAGDAVSGLGANSVFEITTGGTIALNAATGGTASAPLTIQIDKASPLSLSGMSFITAVGSTGADTITANAANQILTGGGGGDTLTGYLGGQDIFRDSTAHLNGATVAGFVASDILDLTDMAATTASLSYNATSGMLSITDGTHAAAITLPGSFTGSSFHLASDGHAGTNLTLA